MSHTRNTFYEFGDFRLDVSARVLSRGGVTVPITPKAIDLLLTLVKQPGRVLDKDALMKSVWPDSFVEENNLADNVFKLRRVLEDRDDGAKFIETVPKRGYRFIAAVRVLDDRQEQQLEWEQPQAPNRPPEAKPLVPPTRGRSQASASWFVAGAVTLIALVLGVASLRRDGPAPLPLRTSLLPPEGASFSDIALSPDGQWLAFTAATGSRVQMWLRSLTSGEAKPLEHTDGASHPFWSPDSRHIGFFTGGKLTKIALTGGLPVTLCPASTGTGGTWSRDGVILFTVLGVAQISRVMASGGMPEVVLHADSGQTDLHEPHFLPDGRQFLYLAIGTNRDIAGIYVGSLDGKLSRRVLEHDSNAVFVAADINDGRRGYLLFGRDGGLMAQGFDSRALRLEGEAALIAARLGTVQGVNLSYRRRNFTASANGLLIYDPHTDRQSSQLLWVDRSAKPLHVLAQLDNLNVPSLSPDESRVVVARKDVATNNNDLWVTDALGGNPVRFTFDSGSDILGLWSPDGQRIVWTSTRNGSFDLYVKEVSSKGQDTLLLRSDEPKFPLDWSRDGRYLLYRQIGRQTNHDIYVLPTSGERKPFAYLCTPAMENGGTFSPDGHWIAYSSDESGRFEVYVESFPTHGGKRQISTGGGTAPRWRGDGKELYYHSLDGRLIAVSVTSHSDSLTTGTPTVLFAFRRVGTIAVPSYASTRNGHRFLLSTIVENDPKAALTIVQNWTAEIIR